MKLFKPTKVGRSFQSVSSKNWNDWKWQYRNRICTLSELAALLGKPKEYIENNTKVTDIYRFCVTPYYFSLIDLEDEDDPIRMQSFPDLREINFSSMSMADPLREEKNMPVFGLIHRYPDRCVALITNVCLTYCRHCNRKRTWHNGALNGGNQHLLSMLDYIRGEKRIREVIVSGGDPLTWATDKLEWFLKSLRTIAHVEVLRIGSRAPVVMPMRINRSLCSMLRRFRPLWFNTQFNHPNEITPESIRACDMLLDSGIPVSNQSVLLKGVNDNYNTMQKLLYGLQRISVRPYYLFQCEPVSGTDHLRTDLSSGVEIMEKLRQNMSGLSLPQYVLDVPDKGKIPLYPVSSSIDLCKFF